MAGYEDTRQKIISTLMGRPNETEIQPENHQDYALNMLDYIRGLELIATSTLIGIAEQNTTPVQPNSSRVCYIAGVAQNQTVTFQNFIDENGNPISVTTGDMEGVFIILMWNTQYWSAQTFSTNIISHSESATFYYRYNIRKTYASIALMNADVESPIGTDGKYIKVGDIVTVVNSTTPSENGIYSYEGATDGWKYQSSFNFQVEQVRSQDTNTSPSSKLFDDELTELNSKVRNLSYNIIGLFNSWAKFNTESQMPDPDGNWRITGYIDVNILKHGIQNTNGGYYYIVYFSGYHYADYISIETINTSDIYEPNIPANAKFAIVQCTVSEINYINIHDYRTGKDIVEGEYIYYLQDGGYSSEGTFDPTSAWKRSQLTSIDCLYHPLTLFQSESILPLIVFFDANENYIGSWNPGTPYSYVNNAIIEIPSNAVYCSFQIQASNLASSGTYYKSYSIKISQYARFVNNPYGDFTEVLQRALDQYKEVIIDRAIVINGTVYLNTSNKLHAEQGVYIYRNNPQTPIMISNREGAGFIEVSGGVWSGNSYRPIDNISDWGAAYHGRVGLFDFYNCINLTVKDIYIQFAGYFAFEFTKITGLRVDNIKFYSCLQDGLHLNGDIDNFHISNISGDTSDDTIALNAWDWTASTPLLGNITNGVVENVYIDAKVANGIRLLCGTEGGVEYTVKRVILRNIYGTSNSNCILMSHQEDVDPSHIAAKAKFYDLTLENISCNSISAPIVYIGNCDISDLNINKISSNKNKYIVSCYNANIDNVLLNNIHINDSVSQYDWGNGIEINSSIVTNLKISNIYATLSNYNSFLTRILGSEIKSLVLESVYASGIPEILRVDNSTIGIVILSNGSIIEGDYIANNLSNYQVNILISNINIDETIKYYTGNCIVKKTDYTQIV